MTMADTTEQTEKKDPTATIMTMADTTEQTEKKDPTATMADFLIDVVKNREKIAAEMLQGVAACETMLKGLPKLLRDLEADAESLDEALKEIHSKLDHLHEHHGMPEEVAEDSKKQADFVIGQGKTLNKSIRALAKGQVTLAKYLRNASMLMMIYSVGDTCGGDAAKLAAKLGKGDEALRALWQSKFGRVF